MNENQQEMIVRLATQYVDALERNIRDRYPTKIINVLEAFHMFNAGMVPEEESEEFKAFWQRGSQNFQELLLQGHH